uniref:Uncharacterized protein n=1 Tax=Anguilla anguilla TaxID=7936 RepID=A0A0E9QSR4_ANGAN
MHESSHADMNFVLLDFYLPIPVCKFAPVAKIDRECWWTASP